jgi:hypothetical protein
LPKIVRLALGCAACAAASPTGPISPAAMEPLVCRSDNRDATSQMIPAARGKNNSHDRAGPGRRRNFFRGRLDNAPFSFIFCIVKVNAMRAVPHVF